MQRILALLIIAFSLTFAAVANAETCTSTASGTWTAIASGTVTWSGCTPTSDDDFIIASPFTVTITSGSAITQNGVAATGVTVNGGGTLVMEAGSALAVNSDGLICLGSSTCNFEGTYRQFGITSPGTEAVPSAQTVWSAGDINLKPGADAALAQISYAIAKHEIVGGGVAATFLEQAIDEIDTTDILCWYTASESSKRPPVDEGYCYQITAADTAGDPYFITFDVRQGDRNQHGYPDVRKDIYQGVLAADAAKGTRTITLAAGAFPSDDYYNGRMLRFEDGTGNEENTSYRIMDSEENGASADTITIADINGFKSGHVTGDDVWIDYGWQSGDTFLVVRPVRITSASAAEEDSDVSLAGDFSVEGLYMNGTGRLVVQAAAVQNKFAGFWGSDMSDSGNDALRFTNTAGGSVSRVTMTGGSTTAGNDVQHQFVISDVVGPFEIDMFAGRYAGDDFFGISGATDAHAAAVHINRFRCQFSSTNASSQGCVKGTSNGTYGSMLLDATNVETLDGLRTGDAMFGSEVTGSAGVLIGSAGVAQTRANGTEAGKFDNLYIVGNRPVTGSSEALMPLNSAHFVLRENVHTVTNGGFHRNTTGSGSYGIDVRDGIVRANTIQLYGLLDVHGVIDNLLFLNNVATTATDASHIYFSVNPPAAGTTVSNTTIIGGIGEFRWGIFATSGVTDATNLTLDGVAFAEIDYPVTGDGLQDSTVGDLVHAQATSLCFFNNVGDSDAPANLPANSIRAIDPGFVNETVGRYDVREGSVWDVAGCGIKRTNPPGVCKMNRALAWSNLTPECQADLSFGGGSGGGGTFGVPGSFGAGGS